MIHNMKLCEKPFNAMKIGYKSIELRLFDEKRQKLQIGDSIEFSMIENENQKLVKKISAIHHFKDFNELFSSLPLLKCGETPFTFRDARAENMEKFYSKEKQQKYSVIGIEFEEIPLQRFIAGHSGGIPLCSGYETALDEIRAGFKSSHWIWYIFPQLKGLTSDTVTEYYALDGRKEAEEFLNHEILGKRLTEISSALLGLENSDPVSVFGLVDAYKIRSCMTLFSEISDNDVFDRVLEKFCMGTKDEKTLEILR